MKIIYLSLLLFLILPAFSENVNDIWDRIVDKKAGEIILASCPECENGMGSVSRGKGIYDLGYENEIIKISKGMQINCLDIISVESGAKIIIKSNNGKEIEVVGPKLAELFSVQQNAYIGNDLGEYSDFACISKHGNDLNEGIIQKLGNFFSGLLQKIKEMLAGESFQAKQDSAGAGVRG